MPESCLKIARIVSKIVQMIVPKIVHEIPLKIVHKIVLKKYATLFNCSALNYGLSSKVSLHTFWQFPEF